MYRILPQWSEQRHEWYAVVYDEKTGQQIHQTDYAEAVGWCLKQAQVWLDNYLGVKRNV